MQVVDSSLCDCFICASRPWVVTLKRARRVFLSAFTTTVRLVRLCILIMQPVPVWGVANTHQCLPSIPQADRLHPNTPSYRYMVHCREGTLTASIARQTGLRPKRGDRNDQRRRSSCIVQSTDKWQARKTPIV